MNAREQKPFSEGGFTIRTDDLTFNTDRLVGIDRQQDQSLIVHLEREDGQTEQHHLKALSALQAWAQIMELATFPKEQGNE